MIATKEHTDEYYQRAREDSKTDVYKEQLIRERRKCILLEQQVNTLDDSLHSMTTNAIRSHRIVYGLRTFFGDAKLRITSISDDLFHGLYICYPGECEAMRSLYTSEVCEHDRSSPHKEYKITMSWELLLDGLFELCKVVNITRNSFNTLISLNEDVKKALYMYANNVITRNYEKKYTYIQERRIRVNIVQELRYSEVFKTKFNAMVKTYRRDRNLSDTDVIEI